MMDHRPEETTSTIAEIKKLFEKLPIATKVDLIAQLQSDGFISVSDFSKLVQRIYAKNILFDIRTDVVERIPIITAIVVTPFGEFTGIGKNQAIAKGLAVQKAFIALNDVKKV